MPQKVDDIYNALKRDNPSMPDDRAWAIAWSTYKKMKKETKERKLSDEQIRKIVKQTIEEQRDLVNAIIRYDGDREDYQKAYRIYKGYEKEEFRSKEDTDYAKGTNQGNPIQIELGTGKREELEEDLRNKLAWNMYKKDWDKLDDKQRQTITTLMKTLPRKEKFTVTDDLAKQLAQYVGIPADITNDDLFDEFKLGLEVEQEHEDVTGGDAKITAKIVKAHLDEDPKYYSKLKSLGLERKEQATTYQGDTFTYKGSRIEVWSDAQGRWSFMIDNLQGGDGFSSKADAIAKAKSIIDKSKEIIYFEADQDIGYGIINPDVLN